MATEYVYYSIPNDCILLRADSYYPGFVKADVLLNERGQVIFAALKRTGRLDIFLKENEIIRIGEV